MLNKKTIGGAIIATFVLAIMVASPFAQATGNGAPSGAHFNLNLIGAKTSNCPQTDGSGGNVIFAPLWGTSKIELVQGTTFAILDNNACTDGVAQFQLPLPTTATGAPSYTVWARAVGKPGGSGTLTTCATDVSTGEIVCSLNQVITMRTHGSQKFVNVTKQLTTLCFVPTGSTTVTCANIFDSAFQNYFWSYNNKGQKILQLRFYPVA
jgi:hypothetical protein